MNSCDCPASPAYTVTSRRSLPLRYLDRLFAAQALSRQRKDLSRLDDTLLRDIGLTRHQAMKEANRPSWDAPSHWRR